MPYWLQLTLFAIIAGLVNFIITYFKEKGKNLATKEDVRYITTEIKSIESKFLHETERLKADLLLHTTLRTTILSEERNAIAEFTKSLVTWINSYQKNYKLESGHIDDFLEDISIAQDKCNLSHSLLLIMVDNQKLIDCADELMRKVNNFNSLQTDISLLKEDHTPPRINAYQVKFKIDHYNDATKDINNFVQLSRKHIHLIDKPEH